MISEFTQIFDPANNVNKKLEGGEKEGERGREEEGEKEEEVLTKI